MQKRLLVLAAGILQIPIIKKAKEMGIFVIAADGNAEAVGFQYADKTVHADITDEEIMLEIARQEKIDGVIHPCSEVSMNVMGRINDELKLSGISREQALKATNKYMMRQAFEDGNAPSPRSYLTKNAEDAWNQYLQFDCDGILKPSRNSGSRGIAKIEKNYGDKNLFFEKYNIALNESRDNSVLLEQFIDGPEFSIEIIVWERQIHVLAITDKKTTGAPYFVELGHSQPTCLPKTDIDEVMLTSIAGVKALGVNNCACHVEVKLHKGKAYLMEIGARLGGDFISTELTHLSTGIDMVAAAINCALGKKPDLESKEKPLATCIRYFCPKPGKLVSISNTHLLNDPRVYLWDIYPKPGDMVPEVTSSLSRSGHVIVTEDTPEKAIELADKLVNEVTIKTL